MSLSYDGDHRHLLQDEEFYILPSPYLVEGTGVRDQN